MSLIKMPPLAIEVQKISKSYHQGITHRSKHALNEVSFSVPKGEIFGFLGPNGAGKTTLIKIMVGILSADQGRCLIHCHGDFFDSHTLASKTKLGYLPERPYFHDFLTAEEFLHFHGRLMGLDHDLIDSKINPLLTKVRLNQARHQKLRTFSKGMLQRIGFAQALLGDPEVLILDEPMGGLDPVGRREVGDMIRELGMAGKTVFFSTHIVHDVEVICTTVGFINQGVLKGFGSIEKLLGKTVKSVEIRYRLPQEKQPSPFLRASRQTMEGWVIDIEADVNALESKVATMLSHILEQKGLIQSVTPRKSTLEELFLGSEIKNEA